MPWRAKCYECEHATGITGPVFEMLSSFVGSDLDNAVAYYETHPRSQADTRPCGGAGMAVPKYHMRGAYSTTTERVSEVPATVELCVRDKDGFPCLGVIHRLPPDGRIYCPRCGENEPGAIYVRKT